MRKRSNPEHTRGKGKWITPGWRRTQQRAVAELKAERAASPTADTELLIPAAQHPLVEGIYPGPEFVERLTTALSAFRQIVNGGGKAAFFLPGNRHHDAASGQTDRVAIIRCRRTVAT